MMMTRIQVSTFGTLEIRNIL